LIDGTLPFDDWNAGIFCPIEATNSVHSHMFQSDIIQFSFQESLHSDSGGYGDLSNTTQQLTAYLKPIELVRYPKNASKQSAVQTTVSTLIGDRFSTI
jgi:hypothetical protein